MSLLEFINWPDFLWFMIFCWFFLYLVFTSASNRTPRIDSKKLKQNYNWYQSSIENINNNFNGDLFKLNKDRRNSQLNLEELYIKKEEHENDIEKLEQEWIMDFKKEKEICGSFGPNKDLYYLLDYLSPIEELKKVLIEGA